MSSEYREMVIRYLDIHHSEVSLNELANTTLDDDRVMFIIHDNYTGTKHTQPSLVHTVVKVFGPEAEDIVKLWLDEKYYRFSQGLYTLFSNYTLKLELDGWRLVDISGEYIDEGELIKGLSQIYDTKLVTSFYLKWFNEKVIFESERIHKIR